MPALVVDIEARFAQFQDSLNRLNSTASQVSGRLEQSFGAITRVFGGLTAAVAAVGFGRMISNTINAADELSKLSQKTGVAVERLSELGYAAKLSDVTTEGLATGLRQLAKSIDEGAKGFERIGVATRNSDGTLRGTDDVLLDVAESFSTLADGAAKSALAQELFGRSGADLIPLLNAGRAGLAAYADEARRAGVVISGETARAAEEFNDNMTRLRANLEGLATVFSAQLIVPLGKVTTSLLDASRAAGSLGEGLVRSLLGQGRDLPNELQRVEVRIAAIRAERDKLKGSLGDSALARSIPFLSRNKDLEEEERSLRVQRDFLVSLKQVRDERARQEQEANRPKTAIKAQEEAPKKTKVRNDDEQRQINASREIARLTAEEAKNRAEIAEAYNRLDLEAQAQNDRKVLEQAAQAASELQSILAATPTGQLAELERRQLLVNEAFVAGKITVDQFNEAFAVLDDSRNQVLGRSKSDFKAISEDGRKAFKDLEFAVQGWGRQFTTTLANAIRTGKFDFQSLVDTVIQGLLEMQIQLAITAPLFKSIQGALGGFFGAPSASGGAPATFGAKGLAIGGSGLMAFARGGVVDRPTMFGFGGGRLGVMGEAGAEAILPLKRGAGGRLGVELTGQRGGGGGVTVNQSIMFQGGVDPAQQAAFARQIKAETLSAVVDALRRGDGNFAPRGA